MKTNEHLIHYIESFLSERLKKEKNVSPHTYNSFCDSFNLLLKYLTKRLKKQPEQLRLSDLKVSLFTQFLNDLEKRRKTCARTRNIRLSAIRSFFRYLTYLRPDIYELSVQILAIPKKKTVKKLIPYLLEDEIEALLKVPNQKTWIGCRDHALIALAIQTGLRVSELIQLKWKDVYFSSISSSIILNGKGRKQRVNNLTKQLVKIMISWKKKCGGIADDFVFKTIRGGPMSVDIIQYLLKKYGMIATKSCLSLKNKQISPHILRHTAAMRLLHAGVDLTQIALWLGHECVETTQMYLAASPKMREEALRKIEDMKTDVKRFRADTKLLKILRKMNENSPEHNEKKEFG